MGIMPLNFLFCRHFGHSVIDVPRQYQLIMVARMISGFIGVQGELNTPHFLPVSTAASLFYTSPVFTAIVGFLFLRERLSIYDVGSMIACFVGTLIINNPWVESVKP